MITVITVIIIIMTIVLLLSTLATFIAVNLLRCAVMSVEQEDVEMVRCSNPDCCFGAWFHVTCMNVDMVPAGDWWCSDECRDTRQSVYCHCKQLNEGMYLSSFHYISTDFFLQSIQYLISTLVTVQRCQSEWITTFLYDDDDGDDDDDDDDDDHDDDDDD